MVREYRRARESQGIQIALIVFVMLAIVLGVTTFVYMQQNGELLKSRKDAIDRAATAEAKAKATEANSADLIRMIVGVSEKPMAEVKSAYEEDMKKYGADMPEELHNYSKIAQRQYETVKKRDADIANASTELANYQKKLAALQKAADARVAEIARQFTEVKSELSDIRSKYEGDEAERRQKEDKYVQQIGDIKDRQNQERADALEFRKQSNATIQRQQQDMREVAKRIDRMTTPRFDCPGGEIATVDQRSRTVWLNRGREDQLEPKTHFGVYAADGANMSKVKKAEIEVTRVVDDHTSLARILDDSITDPIVQGDKIYTPLWSPGDQTHFALAGVMDLDGDGHNAVATARGLITSTGAAVDCYMDDNENVVGEVNVLTRIVVLGTVHGAKNSPKGLTAYDVIVGQADRLAAAKMTLAEFKEKIGYKGSGAVAH